MKTRLEKWLILITAFSMLLMVGMLDLFTGTEVSFDLFYLIPICFLGFYLGRRYGVLMAMFGGVIWFASDIFNGQYHAQIMVHYWNAGVRFFIFSTVVLLLVYLRREREKLKKTTEQLRTSYESLQSLMNRQSEFATMVTHELRTPLVAIQESIKVIQEGMVGSVSELQKEYLAMAVRSAVRLGSLVDDILDFSKLEKEKKQYKIQLNSIQSVIRECLALYRPVALKEGLTMETRMNPAVPELYFDRDAIIQVLTNLIGNALKFTHYGSIIIGTDIKDDLVEVFVKDTGSGVKHEDLERIFEPFTQLHYLDRRRQKGTGLGLTISKLIVEQHGGRIWVESEEGKGTKITFTLSLRRTRWRNLQDLKLARTQQKELISGGV